MGFFRSRDPLEDLGDLSTSDDGLGSSVHFRKSLKRWFKSMWLNILVLCVFAAYGYIIFHHKTPFVTRLFSVTYNDGRIVYPELAYPQRTELLPAFHTTLVSFGVPFVVLCLMQLWVQSFWDWNNAVLGLFYSLIGASVFQVTIKMFIGGLRPHFLAVCKPETFPGWQGQGFQNLLFDRRICKGDPAEIDDALTSFPSGHATAALAGFLYLALYINGKVKVFTKQRSAFWKVMAVMTPVCLGVLLAASKTVDAWHTWYDVLVGGIIGAVFAFIAYRAMYAAVWDVLKNHIPLMRDNEEEDFPQMGGAEDGVAREERQG